MSERPRCRREDNIERDFKELGREVLDWIDLVCDRNSLWTVVNAVIDVRGP